MWTFFGWIYASEMEPFKNSLCSSDCSSSYKSIHNPVSLLNENESDLTTVIWCIFVAVHVRTRGDFIGLKEGWCISIWAGVSLHECERLSDEWFELKSGLKKVTEQRFKLRPVNYFCHDQEIPWKDQKIFKDELNIYSHFQKNASVMSWNICLL